MDKIHHVPAILFSAVTTALDNLGITSERVVGKAGLPMWQFHEPQARVPGAHFYRLFGHSARAAGDEKFGLLVPVYSPLSSMGSLGRRISRAVTVYDAIKSLAELVHRFSSNSKFWIVEGSENLWFFRERYLSADTGCRQVEIATLMWMTDVVRLGAGPGWRPPRICLEGNPIPGLDRREDFADIDIRCRQGLTAFAIPRSLLSLPINANGGAPGPAKDDGLLSEAPSNEFVGSLRQVLRSFLVFGHPRIEAIAEIAGLSARTLQRRLAAEGLSFKKVVDEARFQAAAGLMSDPDVKLVEIAHDLGYADQAHFTRAFRRIAGMSPREYRRRQLVH